MIIFVIKNIKKLCNDKNLLETIKNIDIGKGLLMNKIYE